MERKGKCTQAGVCSMYDKVQIITDDDAEFKCCECGEELTPYKEEEVVKDNGDGGKKKKLIGIIVAVLAVIGGGVGAFFAFSGNSVKGITLDKQEITLVVGQKDVLKATADPADAKATFTFKAGGKNIEVSSGGEITALKKGDATIIVKCEENPELRATCKVTVTEPEAEPQGEGETTTPQEPVQVDPAQTEPAQTEPAKTEPAKAEPDNTSNGGSGKTGRQDGTGVTKNPSWGRYEGPRNAEGLAHGNGIVYITKSTTIKGQQAQAGERIEGVFRNGYVNLGTWYKKDGNAVSVKDIKVY